MNKAEMQEVLGIKWEVRRVFGTHDQVQVALVYDGKDIESLKCTADHLCTLHKALDNFIKDEHDPFFNVSDADIFWANYQRAKMYNRDAFVEVDKLIEEMGGE